MWVPLLHVSVHGRHAPQRNARAVFDSIGALLPPPLRAGPSFGPYARHVLSMLASLAGSPAHDNAAALRYMGRLANAALGALGPELATRPKCLDNAYVVYGQLKVGGRTGKLTCRCGNLKGMGPIADCPKYICGTHKK